MSKKFYYKNIRNFVQYWKNQHKAAQSPGTNLTVSWRPINQIRETNSGHLNGENYYFLLENKRVFDVNWLHHMTVEKPLYIFEIHSFVLIFILTNKQVSMIVFFKFKIFFLNSKLSRWANDDHKLYKTAFTHMICQSFEEDHIKVSLSMS